MAAGLTRHLMRKAAGSIIQGMTQPEKPVSRWKAPPDAGRFWSLTERFRTWSIIIGLTLFSPLPLSVPFVLLAQGEVHSKTSVIKAADQPTLYYLIILIALCAGLSWTCRCLEAALNRFRLISRR